MTAAIRQPLVAVTGPDVPTHRTLHIAYAHLPGGDLDALEAFDGAQVHQLGDWGALLYVPEDPEHWLGRYDTADAATATLGLQVLAVQLFARRHDCAWVMFDVDAPRVDLTVWEQS